jgi:predicted dehydrogenase
MDSSVSYKQRKPVHGSATRSNIPGQGRLQLAFTPQIGKFASSERRMDLNIYPPLPRRKDFRIGILGSGFVVNECHLVAYRKAGFNPVAIASRNRANAEKTAQRHHISKAHDSYDALLDDTSIEVLDIAVPPDALFDLIRKACRKKHIKGILAQKPLGLDYKQAVAMVDECQTAGITLAVNQNMRFDHSVRAAKTLLQNGTIGEPVIASIDMRGIPHWQPWQAGLGWATLRIMSIHHLDTFRYWFGEPQRIFCSTRPDPRTQFPHSDGICAYILEYANGLRCIAIDDPWTGPAKEGCPADIGIHWRIEGLNGLALGSIGWCHEPCTTPSTIKYAAKGDHGFESPVWPESWFPDAFIGTMVDLLIALEQAKTPSISGRDNLKTMTLVDAAYVSAKVHEAVEPQDIIGQISQSQGGLAKSQKWKWWKSALSRLTGPSKPSKSISTPKSFVAGPDKFLNITPSAQQALTLARKQAESFNHNFVGTEHLLLGLMTLGRGTAFDVLGKMGLALDTLTDEIKSLVGTGPDQKMIGNIPYTPRVKRVLALAAREARELNHPDVGTGHILLGLLREGDGVAARVLKKLDVTIDQTRAELLRAHATGQHLTHESVERQQQAVPAHSSVPKSTGQAQMSEFTPRAQQVLALARREAGRFHRSYVGTEDLLLGLIALGQGVGVTVLRKLGLNLENVRIEVEKLVCTGSEQETVGNAPYTPRVKKVLVLAAKQARTLKHTYVGTEHILLGLLEEGDGVAARVLQNLGVKLEETQKEILKELDPNFGKE